jgi:hypothetical protein
VSRGRTLHVPQGNGGGGSGSGGSTQTHTPTNTGSHRGSLTDGIVAASPQQGNAGIRLRRRSISLAGAVPMHASVTMSTREADLEFRYVVSFLHCVCSSLRLLRCFQCAFSDRVFVSRRTSRVADARLTRRRGCLRTHAQTHSYSSLCSCSLFHSLADAGLMRQCGCPRVCCRCHLHTHTHTHTIQR